MKAKVAIIGSGSMGTALGVLLANNVDSIDMWTPFKEEAEMLNTERQHRDKLPGVVLPEKVSSTTDMEKALKGADVVVMAVPSQTTRKVASEISKYFSKDGIVVCCSKGIEEDTCMLLSDVIEQEMPGNEVVILSGPSHAEEIAKDIPTAVVSASRNISAAEYIQEMFITPTFRVYTNPDVIGVELGGALKNVIALCAGISDGLGYGDNTKAALMTRGMAEISRLGIAMGAMPQTFFGLTGIGDLIVTCTSMHSRNRRAGILIGQGKSLKEALDEVKMVVEGVSTVKPACRLASKYNVSMPIMFQAYEVLFNGKSPREAVSELMTRDRKHEI